LNYAELAARRMASIVVRTRSAGVRPRTGTLIINATGGWIDITNHGALFSPEARPAPLMGGTKGSHLIIDNAALRDALADHMIYYENEDGRICILFPYLGKVLVGSTDIRVDDPETVRCEADERDYILQSLAFVLPGSRSGPRRSSSNLPACGRCPPAPTVLPAAFRAIISARSSSQRMAGHRCCA
jgi:glycerol-3-phosphate dehydrogenase